MTDDNPRAVFDASDLEYMDFILCVDSQVRDRVLEIASFRAGRNRICNMKHEMQT